MAKTQNFTEFYWGEDIEFSMLAKNRGGSTALTGAASADIEFNISPKNGGDNVLSFTLTDDEIVLSDAPTAAFAFQVQKAAYSSTLVAGHTYHYDIFSIVSGNRLHQMQGTLVLQPAANA